MLDRESSGGCNELALPPFENSENVSYHTTNRKRVTSDGRTGLERQQLPLILASAKNVVLQSAPSALCDP